ncbi:MAG: ATP-binding protein [Pseudomonadota bacterium]
MSEIPADTPLARAERAGLRGLLRRLGGVINAGLRPVLRRLPRGLFARSLLIVLVPILILQAVMTFVFMDRHWDLVTRRLSDAVGRDVSLIVDMMDAAETPEARNEVIRSVARRLEMFLDILPEDQLPPPLEYGRLDILQQSLTRQLGQKIARPVWVDAMRPGKFLEVRVLLENETRLGEDEVGTVLRATIRRSHAYASNSHIFLVWMSVASIVLITLAVLFLRNQIQPIVALSRAAERFGRGMDAPALRPRGAREVRRAALAFQQMRARIERFVEQRTVMLAGVSHDLRTVITRFRLQLALFDDTPEVEELKRDVDEMEAMLEGYLSFVKGGGGEVAEEIDIAALVAEVVADQPGDTPIAVRHEGARMAVLRPQNMRRLVANLVGNACRYGTRIEVATVREETALVLTVDDDGPGIPEDRREQALKPFSRLDTARQQTGGNVGLGLAIAHDIARAHGGDMVLEDSALGGLRVRVALPV